MAITAVAPHLAVAEIASAARGPLVSVLDTIGPGLAIAGAGKVAVFGDWAVMEADVFGCLPASAVVRHDPAQLDAVHAAYRP